jgi:hypothetical protein
MRHKVLTKDGIEEVEITPSKACRMKCLECCCFQLSEVKHCKIKSCALWPYRMGKNPARKGLGGIGVKR